MNTQPLILCVYAHPDDETFCSGGTLAKYAAQGAEIMVISATRGQAGQIQDVQAATRRTLGAAREQELQRACECLGVHHSICWDYMDGRLQEADPVQLIGDVVRAIRSFRPDIVITFDPTGAYGHPDHIAISHATTSACMICHDPNHYPEHLTDGLRPHNAARLYHSYFPNRRSLMLDQLVKWLAGQRHLYRGSLSFIQGLSIFAEESLMLRYANDFVTTRWYPPGFCIVEQGEIGTSLYIIISGEADVVQEAADGTLSQLSQLSAGDFFGEMALVEHKPRMAHVIARTVVTCMIFSPGAPTTFAGRGADAALTDLQIREDDPTFQGVTACIDVSPYIRQKIRAVAAHRTQYPIDPDMFPESMLIELFGREYFIRVHPPTTFETDLI
ncbi:MAG: PIG-L family deacetylase [Anaerolineae bacterium]|nr:PIG-L family deacetylase [Anaerolineae bacterium]